MSNQLLFGSFKRLRNFPIDPSDFFETLKELEKYTSTDATVHLGQKTVVYNDPENNGLYLVLKNENGELYNLK